MVQRIFGDLAAFSFCQDKIITTGGEGGLLALDDEPMWRNARDLPALRVPVVPDRLRHGYYRTYAYVRSEALRAGRDRQRIIDEIAAQGVPCYAGSAAEIYLEKAFRDARLAPAERLPVAQELGETSLCFLCHPTLSDEAVGRTIEVVGEVVGRAMR